MNDSFGTFTKLDNTRGYYSILKLEEMGIAAVSRLPVSIRIMLESLLRNCDEKRVKKSDVTALAQWNSSSLLNKEIPFLVTRVLLQDFTGVPLLVDLASMRDAAVHEKCGASLIEPKIPVHLVIDHSVQVDRSNSPTAFAFNLEAEFERNKERYEFLKWGQEAFKTFKVVPPGIGICHQVNLEYLSLVVHREKSDKYTVLFPDTLVGTDSHTTMINGLGILGWGVGGIEAESAMLGQPIFIQMPEVVGVHLKGTLRTEVNATDLTLRITELLRRANVVGKFVEFFGEGAATLSTADRATIANMAPEYGATIGFFPCDDKTIDYLRLTGRQENQLAEIKEYLKRQGLFGMPKKDDINYSKLIELDLSSIALSVAGPKKPQDRIDITHLKHSFETALTSSITEGGYGKSKQELDRLVCIQRKTNPKKETSLLHHSPYTPIGNGGKPTIDAQEALPWNEDEMVANRPFHGTIANPEYTEKSPPPSLSLRHGSIVIAAITSCTNTSNPYVMIGAGLLAKKAVLRGLTVSPSVKTSLAPGSRIVTDYLNKSGLQPYLDQLGFQLVAYGCTTCIGNSGPLEAHIEQAIRKHDLIVASVLSGNRNFEARIHASVKANFLMSPPLVIAFALAGRIDFDLKKEPLGIDALGKEVYFKEIWPSPEEITECIDRFITPSMFQERYAHLTQGTSKWNEIKVENSSQFKWKKGSSYIQSPPYFDTFSRSIPSPQKLENMRALAIFGDGVTTDHISPAGMFSNKSAAGQYLLSLGIKENEFNSYGSRRGNHHVMTRGTFANIRIMNKMANGKEGGYTQIMPDKTLATIYEATEYYEKNKVPLIIFAGKDYGLGSSRDWAAKGTALLGVRIVVASSFERIHRSNLVGMGVLPLQFQKGENGESLHIKGTESFTLEPIQNWSPQSVVTLRVAEGEKERGISLILRLDTSTEIEYYKNGGILPYVLRQLIAEFEKTPLQTTES